MFWKGERVLIDAKELSKAVHEFNWSYAMLEMIGRTDLYIDEKSDYAGSYPGEDDYYIIYADARFYVPERALRHLSVERKRRWS